MRCDSCGIENPEANRYCGGCGRALTAGTQSQRMSSTQHQVGLPASRVVRSRKKKLVAGTVIAILVVAFYTSVLLLLSSQGDSGGGSSPSDCLNKMGTYLSQQEWDKVVDCFYFHFLPEYQQEDWASSLASSGIEELVSFSNITPESESGMSIDDVAYIYAHIKEVENETGRNVTEWAVLECDEILRDRDTGVIVSVVPDWWWLFVEIESRWYAVQI